MRPAAPASLVLGLLVAACAPEPGRDAAPLPERPNVLLVLLDDLGVDTVGAYGATPSHTPRLDALAATGVRFTNVWASPFCEPSRAALQTGRYGFRTGVGSVGKGGLALEEVTLAEMLSIGTDGAYVTAAIGKWHLASDENGKLRSPNLAGYGHFAGTMGNLEDYYAYRKVVDGELQEKRAYATSDQVGDALTWIRGAPEPWFCYVAFNAVHHPLHAPPPRMHGVELPSGDLREVGEAMFDAMVQSADRAVGMLVDGLDAGVRERTTVVVLSDNGSNRYHLEGPVDANAGKGTVRQSGIHVPLIVSGAGVTAPGRTSAALVDVTDVFATVAELAAVDLERLGPELSGPLDSKSFAPLLRSPDASPSRETAYSESFRPNGPGPWVNTRRALRDERYKLIAIRRANGAESEELYDLVADPAETRDLLRAEPDAERVRRAYERLSAELAELLDSN